MPSLAGRNARRAALWDTAVTPGSAFSRRSATQTRGDRQSAERRRAGLGNCSRMRRRVRARLEVVCCSSLQLYELVPSRGGDLERRPAGRCAGRGHLRERRSGPASARAVQTSGSADRFAASASHRSTRDGTPAHRVGFTPLASAALVRDVSRRVQRASSRKDPEICGQFWKELRLKRASAGAEKRNFFDSDPCAVKNRGYSLNGVPAGDV